jgi:hypothetical protein
MLVQCQWIDLATPSGSSTSDVEPKSCRGENRRDGDVALLRTSDISDVTVRTPLQTTGMPPLLPDKAITSPEWMTVQPWSLIHDFTSGL